MEEFLHQNYAEIAGEITAVPRFSHETKGERFYSMPVAVQRLSGTYDVVNVQCREAQLPDSTNIPGTGVHIFGQLRSYNNKSAVGPKLVISVFAKNMIYESIEDKNDITLCGTICKTPVLRRTPLGREICDFMLAVNRRYGRSDYIPCITWGQKAHETVQCTTGSVVALSGRFQSRTYLKMINDRPIEKTAYEVSVIELEIKK